MENKKYLISKGNNLGQNQFMIKNVVFDNGGVIVEYSAETYLNYFKLPKETQNELNQLFTTKEWVSFAKGEITSQDFKNYAVNKFPQYKDIVLSILDVKNLKFMIPPYTKTINFIKNLKRHNFRVFLLSDINEDTIKYLNEEIPDFESLFDGVMYSCRIGMIKKEGVIFHELLKKYSLLPQETLFIDDNEINLKMAQKYNINTYRFSNPNQDIQLINKLLK